MRALRWHKRGFWSDCGIPLQLYLAAGMASMLLPSIVALPQYEEPLSYLIVAAHFGVGRSGVLDPRRDETQESGTRRVARSLR